MNAFKAVESIAINVFQITETIARPLMKDYPCTIEAFAAWLQYLGDVDHPLHDFVVQDMFLQLMQEMLLPLHQVSVLLL